MSNWQSLLARCNKALLEARELPLQRDYDVRAIQYFGFPAANERDIADAEARLGRRLPPSLRTFYAASNGWRIVGPFIYAVPPVHSLAWLRDSDPELCESVDVDGDDDQSVAVMRSLAVSSHGDASVWILDPDETDERGEWRAGRWSAWYPGTDWIAADFYSLFESEVAFMEESNRKDGEPGATDNPDDAQRLREDH